MVCLRVAQVKIWDITDEPTAIKTIRVASKVAPGTAQRLRLAWHPSGDSIAIPFANAVHLLERSSWSVGTVLRNGHSKDVSLVSWSPNGQYLASAGLDRQVYVWQLDGASDLDRYKADAPLSDLCWSPTDNALAFLDEAGQLALWQAPIPAHLAAPNAAAATAATAAAAPPAGSAVGASASAAAAATAGGGSAAGGGATVFSMGDDDAIVDDVATGGATADAGGGGAEGGAEGGVEGGAQPARRRLRKVMHDSDDGGFSDHDDDEAAEAAMLAQQLAKQQRAGRGGALDGGVFGGASSADPAARAALGAAGALVAGVGGGAPLQPVLHSSATPAKNGRRFLLWNMVGMVISRDENVFSAIEVEFNSTERHRTIRLTDHYSFTMAALDDAAVMFASRSNHGNPSTIVYRPLASWAPNSDWQVQLEAGEEAEAVALGHKFAAIATSKRLLRIFSHTGAQRALLCIARPLVALAAHDGLLAVLTHAGRAADPADQALEMTMYDMGDSTRPVRIAQGALPLSAGATLEWVGFSEGGMLCTVDTAGLVRGCVRASSYEWAPLLDCATVKKSKNEAHWIVGLTERELICVLCKGDDRYPATLPRPVTTPLPLAMPLTLADNTEPHVEKERALSALLLNEYRSSVADDGTEDTPRVRDSVLRSLLKLDATVLKLVAAACKADRTARALDLVTQLQLPKSLTGALKLANHYRLGPLAERIARLMEQRFEDDDDADVEEAPPPRAPPPPRARAAPPPAAAPPAAAADGDDGDADGDAAEEEEEGDADGGASPTAATNPFAKGGGGAGKAILKAAETHKGPKRSLPVTSAVGGKKLRK